MSCVNITLLDENATFPPCNEFPPNVPPIDLSEKMPIENIILYAFLSVLSFSTMVLIAYIGKNRRRRVRRSEETAV